MSQVDIPNPATPLGRAILKSAQDGGSIAKFQADVTSGHIQSSHTWEEYFGSPSRLKALSEEARLDLIARATIPAYRNFPGDFHPIITNKARELDRSEEGPVGERLFSHGRTIDVKKETAKIDAERSILQDIRRGPKLCAKSRQIESDRKGSSGDGDRAIDLYNNAKHQAERKARAEANALEQRASMDDVSRPAIDEASRRKGGDSRFGHRHERLIEWGERRTHRLEQVRMIEEQNTVEENRKPAITERSRVIVARRRGNEDMPIADRLMAEHESRQQQFRARMEQEELERQPATPIITNKAAYLPGRGDPEGTTERLYQESVERKQRRQDAINDAQRVAADTDAAVAIQRMSLISEKSRLLAVGAGAPDHIGPDYNTYVYERDMIVRQEKDIARQQIFEMERAEGFRPIISENSSLIAAALGESVEERLLRPRDRDLYPQLAAEYGNNAEFYAAAVASGSLQVPEPPRFHPVINDLSHLLDGERPNKPPPGKRNEYLYALGAEISDRRNNSDKNAEFNGLEECTFTPKLDKQSEKLAAALGQGASLVDRAYKWDAQVRSRRKELQSDLLETQFENYTFSPDVSRSKTSLTVQSSPKQALDQIYGVESYVQRAKKGREIAAKKAADAERLPANHKASSNGGAQEHKPTTPKGPILGQRVEVKSVKRRGNTLPFYLLDTASTEGRDDKGNDDAEPRRGVYSPSSTSVPPPSVSDPPTRTVTSCSKSHDNISSYSNAGNTAIASTPSLSKKSARSTPGTSRYIDRMNNARRMNAEKDEMAQRVAAGGTPNSYLKSWSPKPTVVKEFRFGQHEAVKSLQMPVPLSGMVSDVVSGASIG